MTAYVALLRAVNVGGTGKLPMADLRAIAQDLGLANVRTYIASGNLLFDSDLGEAELKAVLETRLEDYAGKPVAVMLRTSAEMAAILAANPFPDANGSRYLVYFLDNAPAANVIETAKGRQSERIALGRREIFVDYGEAIRETKLKFAGDKTGTARNMNSVAKLFEMMGGAKQ